MTNNEALERISKALNDLETGVTPHAKLHDSLGGDRIICMHVEEGFTPKQGSNAVQGYCEKCGRIVWVSGASAGLVRTSPKGRYLIQCLGCTCDEYEAGVFPSEVLPVCAVSSTRVSPECREAAGLGRKAEWEDGTVEGIAVRILTRALTAALDERDELRVAILSADADPRLRAKVRDEIARLQAENEHVREVVRKVCASSNSDDYRRAVSELFEFLFKENHGKQ